MKAREMVHGHTFLTKAALAAYMETNMSQSRTLLALALVAALLPACSDLNPVGVEPESAEPQSIAQASRAAPDLSGAWNWRNEETLRMPRWFVEAMGPVLGITPEGENTHAHCESSGTMTLAQTGIEFEGTATKTFNACETTGGQTFKQPGVAIQVADGVIRGRSTHFSFQTATVRPCPHHAVVSEVQDGVVVALTGAGRCVLPGHPQSDSPINLDPPPGGTSTTLSWEASRP
jgi:hypothetical protein